MKYIRTKDGRIIDTTKYYIENSNLFKTGAYQEYKKELANACKQADTIEELCDLFAYNKTFVQGQMLQEIKRYYGTRYQGILYAYTFGENGDIIKVAKMNEKGELELL